MCNGVGMARPLRVEYPGANYHITVRMLGDWKREENRLFEDDEDRERFLASLGERVEQYQIRLYLFVLMSNHFHLVLETPRGNCGRFMQALGTAYTVYFNLRHDRHGHLLDGRYKAKLVEGDEYLLKLTRYVHLNPVYVKGDKDLPIKERIHILRSYPWSSYRSYIGLAKPLDFVKYGPVLAEMPGKRKGWARNYRKYVESGLAEDDQEFQQALKGSPYCIGGEGFTAWVGEKIDALKKTHKQPEDVSFRKISRQVTAETVLGELSRVFSVPVEAFQERRRDSNLRAVGARYLCRYAGLTQREAAKVLKVGSGAAISHQIRRLEGMLSEDRRLRHLTREFERRIERQKEPPTR